MALAKARLEAQEAKKNAEAVNTEKFMVEKPTEWSVEWNGVTKMISFGSEQIYQKWLAMDSDAQTEWMEEYEEKQEERTLENARLRFETAKVE